MTQQQQKKQRRRVSILGADLASGNLGINALASGAVACVLAGDPNAEITLLDYGRIPAEFPIKTRTGVVVAPLVNLRFSKNLWAGNHVATLLAIATVFPLLRKSWRERLGKQIPALAAYLSSECVIAIGGGDSFSDIYGLVRLWYVALPQLIALRLRRRLVIAPQTLGPFRSRTARLLARFILRRAAAIFSRDENGFDTVREVAGAEVAEKVRFCPDLGFLMPAEPPEACEVEGLQPRPVQGRKRIGINVSGLLWVGGYTGSNMFGLALPYRRMIEAIMDAVLAMPDTEVLLVPHVVTTARESDGVACREVYQRFRGEFGERVGLVSSSSPNGVKGAIGTCHTFIGSRMHACIGALSQGVPAVGIAYSGKFAGVFKSVDAQDLVIDARRCTGVEEITGLVRFVIQDHGAWTCRIKTRLGELKHSFDMFTAAILEPESANL